MRSTTPRPCALSPLGAGPENSPACPVWALSAAHYQAPAYVLGCPIRQIVHFARPSLDSERQNFQAMTKGSFRPIGPTTTPLCSPWRSLRLSLDKAIPGFGPHLFRGSKSGILLSMAGRVHSDPSSFFTRKTGSQHEPKKPTNPGRKPESRFFSKEFTEC